MNKDLIAGLGVLAALIIFGAVILFYGQTRENLGKSKCETAVATASSTAVVEGVKDRVETEIEVQRVPDAGLDAELSALGLLRRSEDY